MESSELTAVIVTLKSEDKIFSCIDSIPNQVKIIIVENSNNVKFKENIENKYKNVKCILSGENKGYAVANNIGLGQVKTKFALVLNPDTTLQNDTINNFFQSVKINKDFWLIGPSNNQSSNYSFEKNKYVEVENLKGFAIFFNVEKFQRAFFDENFFLFFEEIDLCKSVKLRKGKILICKDIIINHEGESSVKKDKEFELEKNRNWHWMWSTFYYHKKYKGYFLALLIISPKLISSFLKTIFYQLIFSNQKRDIYFSRMSGIMNSIIGKKSWYRPSLD